ncbi:uncharacterized protein [Parasteatoda tepidariorum]|uniref:uncharacterized protein n=1 Tax=Parasteatoda tepidariorum TaxID=114398 RepID=UPI00077F8A2C|nr:uncharacterized protein LOC107438349 [Parasteatoda tepidariorum]
MLQSTANLLGSTSSVWNSQYLQKILRIPEDQLKILNNIPGWTSKVESAQNSQSLNTVSNKDKENQQTSSISVEPASTLSQKALAVDLNKSEKNSEDTNRKDRFPLRKSSSLDSVSIHKINPSLRILKRSSSASDIEEKAAAVQISSFDTHNSCFGNKAILTKKSSLSKIEEVKEMPVDMDHRSSEKSQFSSSGVQCQMSQDLNLELDVFQTNAALSIPSSNFSKEKESRKIWNEFSPTRKSKNDCFDNAGLSREILTVKSKVDADESYLSQPVPCAQPIPESLHLEKELVSDQKECAPAQNKNFSSFSRNVPSPSDKASSNLSGKRKRKSRSEKSKKHKGINAEHVKIEYSLEQIKNMIELVKVLHKY